MNARIFGQTILYLGAMALFGFGLILLTGCAKRPVEIVTQFVETPLADRISASLLTCRKRPPTGSFAMQSGVAFYLLKIEGAHLDCESKVTAIGDIAHADTARLKAASIGETTTTGGPQ